MDTNLKNRLVGATVLFSLGVIFIPMLLDGRPEPVDLAQIIPAEPAPSNQALTLPEETDLSAVQIEQNSVKPIVESQIKSEPVNSDYTQDQVFQLNDVQLDEPEKVNKVPESDSKKQLQVGFDRQAWVIQVGSFASAKNAHGLTRKLQKMGYQAFEEEIFTKKKAIYRVRVGPEASLKRAKKIQQEIKSKTSLDGMVVRYH
jgi:DedD protein